MSDDRLEDAQHVARREAAPFVFAAALVDALLAARSAWHDWRLYSANDWWVWLVLALPALVLAVVFLLGLGQIGVTSRHRRKAAVILLGLLAAANLVAVGLVLGSLVAGGGDMTGPQLLASAAVVLVVNVITFSLVFWELDCGGPVARALADRRVTPDFQFPQDENPQLARRLGAGAQGLPVRRGDELDRIQPHRRDAVDASGEAVHGHRVADRRGDRADRRRPRGQHPPRLTSPDGRVTCGIEPRLPRSATLEHSHEPPTPATGCSQAAALRWATSKSPERRRNDETHEGTHAPRDGRRRSP